MEDNVRIIRLGDVNAPIQAYSFEDAFGEYSEARGKGRARRKQRKLERISNRNEVKLARQSARGERQQGRIAKRTDAQAARESKRTQAEGLRAERKFSRKQHRVERKAIGQEQDEAGTQEQGLDTGVTQEMGNTNAEAPQQQLSDSQSQDTSSQEQGYNSDAPSEQSDNSGSYDANYGSAEESYDYGNEDTTGQDGDYSDEGDYTGGGDYLGDYNDVEAPFDGVMGAEDRFSEFTSSDIDPSVQDTVNKLVWNKELVNRLEQQRNSIGGGERKQSISKQILLRKKRANELQSQLDGYCNCEGDYVNADGKVVAGKRKAEVAKAYIMANKAKMNKTKIQVTPVARGLKADISKNRIVIPSSSFTGLNGLDLQDDFDAPDVREIKLGADGSNSSSISWKNVAIGVAVGALAIWAIRKYKLIK